MGGGFNLDLLKLIESQKPQKGIIYFGGIDYKIASRLLESKSCTGTVIGNKNFEMEVILKYIRHDIELSNKQLVRRDSGGTK